MSCASLMTRIRSGLITSIRAPGQSHADALVVVCTRGVELVLSAANVAVFVEVQVVPGGVLVDVLVVRQGDGRERVRSL